MSDESDNPVQVGQTCAVVTIEHKHGTNVSVHPNRESAVAEAARFVREWWDEVAIASEMDEPPEDNEEAVNLYFDVHESETCTITTERVQE